MRASCDNLNTVGWKKNKTMEKKQDECQEGGFRNQGKISPADQPESPKRPGHKKQRGYTEAHFAFTEQITPEF
jgi:hypothetical protein